MATFILISFDLFATNEYLSHAKQGKVLNKFDCFHLELHWNKIRKNILEWCTETYVYMGMRKFT